MQDDALAELKEWVQYEPDDAGRLSACLPVIEPELARIIDRFYDEVQRHPGSRDVLTGPEQVERLKKTLRQWLYEVFRGPHDEAYAERRRAIGHRHVKVGLPNRYMVTAMHVIETEVGRLLRARCDDPFPAIDSLHRVLCIDLALMSGTYVSSHGRLQLDTLHELLVEHLRVAVLLVDENGVVRSATRPSAQLVAGAEVTGRPWQEALPPGLLEASALDTQVERALAHHREVTLPRVDVGGDAEGRSFRVYVVPLRHELATFLIQIEELTDAVDMESRLRRSEALAQLGALSAAVAHELRNPLAGISGALQVITRTMDAESSQHRILMKVESEVRRLNSLVTDLLAFARPGSAALQKVDLAYICSEVVELVQSDHKAVTVRIQGTGSAQADPNLLRQILHNLVRNAVDAVDGKGEVLVSVADATLSVSDSGPGVPPEKREEIFEPFVTTKTRGTGLGLAISQRSAEAMNGSLRIVEGPLRGACFELRLMP
ncbi:MAG: PAS domain-containing protein [Alphaproteobacteria bacterium]|nr:PAS domain-containing protein [Alphaproteobacteria bacterium]